MEATGEFIGKVIKAVPVKSEQVVNIKGAEIRESEHFPFAGFPPTVSVVSIPEEQAPQEEFSDNLVDLVQTSRHHARSYELPLPRESAGQVWEDEFGIMFGSVNIKGNNLADPKVEKDQYLPQGFRVKGMLEADMVDRVTMVSQTLRSVGVDTEKIEAIIRPQELVAAGRRMTVQEFKEFLLKRVSEDKPTSLMASLFGEDRSIRAEEIGDVERYLDGLNLLFVVRSQQMAERPRDLEAVLDEESFNEIIARTFGFINAREQIEAQRDGREPKVLSPDNPDDVEYYFTDYFPRRLARNIARMHNAGLTHGFLTAHNVSLTGSIYDLDSVYGEVLGDHIPPAYTKDITTFIDEMGKMFLQTTKEKIKQESGQKVPYFSQALGPKLERSFFRKFAEEYLSQRNIGFSEKFTEESEISLRDLEREIEQGRQQGLTGETFISELEKAEQEMGKPVQEDLLEWAVVSASKQAIPGYIEFRTTSPGNRDSIQEAIEEGRQDAMSGLIDRAEQEIGEEALSAFRKGYIQMLHAA